MNQEEAVKIFDIAIKAKALPATLDKLVPLSFIGAAAVQFYRSKVKLMDQLGMSEAQRKATLADGQDAGEMLLNIEARIGELIEAVPEKEIKSAAQKGQRSLPDGVSHDRSHVARAIHREMQKPGGGAVARVIKEARKNEDIPTKTAVLQRIKLDRLQEQIGKPKTRDMKDITVVALALARELGDVVAKLPAIWKEGLYISDSVKQSIVDAIRKLSQIIEEQINA